MISYSFLYSYISQSTYSIPTYVVMPDGTDRIYFFQPPYAAARIQTHISHVPPNQRDLLKDALHTEPQHNEI